MLISTQKPVEKWHLMWLQHRAASIALMLLTDHNPLSSPWKRPAAKVLELLQDGLNLESEVGSGAEGMDCHRCCRAFKTPGGWHLRGWLHRHPTSSNGTYFLGFQAARVDVNLMLEDECPDLLALTWGIPEGCCPQQGFL